ncbi:hypothetical protein [Streptomyces xantholiticus]|uniref:Uncharacterized protein n=1 Tax=Streptomyces xantholiticus TaxID=68285 RepID=A0ABV1UZT8_9ACTN
MSNQAERHATAETGRRLRENSRPDLDFTPVRNGMDYLISAVTNLKNDGAAPPSDRDLKYAVLHLQAATEVLLKARLVHVHWSLVFKDPGNASRKAYENGKFESCNITATMDRLTKIAQVAIDDKDRAAIKDLADTRNALTHFGHTANAFAVEAKASQVLGFLLTFIHRHLVPVLAEESKDIEQTMATLRAQYRDITAFVTQRMKDLASSLDPLAESTVECPDCFQWALPIREDTPATCHFCLAQWEIPQDVAQEYGLLIRGEDDFRGLRDCPCCGEPYCVGVVNTVQSKETDVALCFGCGDVFYERRVRDLHNEGMTG